MIFRNWVLQNFPFLEDDFDALTDYELFCKMVEYMKKSLDKIKEYQGELTEFRAELDSYKNYFDNLDVQEEIDNKLDEMAESGQLAEIIAEYLNLITNLVFNTVADMKTAENLANGNYVKTLGFYETGDGGSAYYHIRNVTNDDDIDEHFIIAVNDVNLVAEFIMIGKDFHSKQVGLVGDDETDETEILQKFFDYKNDYDINKIIDEGIYLTSDTINIKGRIEQIGQTGQGYKNGTYRIKFDNACIHCNDEELDYAIKIYQFYDGIIDGLHLTRDTYYENKVLISACKRTVIKNFWLRNLELNNDPSLISDTLDSYSTYHIKFEDGYLRGQVIIDPYNATTHYINGVYFDHCSIHAFGIASNIVLKQNFSKQEIVFNECDLSGSDDSIYDVAVRQVNPYITNGVGACSITAINCYYDSNVTVFKDNTKNNIIYNEIGSRFSGNETQNLPQLMEEYFTTTKLGISSNHVKGQLPISNLNYVYNGTIKSHTLEDANTERLFGSSTANITKTYVQKQGYAKYDYVRRLTFEETSDTYQVAQASRIAYTGPACVGIMFEFVSGKCDIEFAVGYSETQYIKINKADIKSGINMFTCGKQDQLFQSGAWGDVRINFTNIEEGTVLDIYEIGLQTGEIYMFNAFCKGE